MKKYYIILIIFSIFFIVACAKKQPMLSSEYIWNPETNAGRLLKILYLDELMDVFNKLSTFNAPVQQNGIGFTVAEKCQQESCSDEEMSKFWLFIASTLDLTVSANDYNTIEKRAKYVVKKRLPDFLLFVKDANIEKLYKDTNFMGLMFSFTWKYRYYPKGLVEPANFETVHIFIPKEPFKSYEEKNITFDDLLKASETYIKVNKQVGKKLSF